MIEKILSARPLCVLLVIGCLCGECIGFRVRGKGDLPAWHPHIKDGHGHTHRETSGASNCSWSEDLLATDSDVAALFKGMLVVSRAG